MDGKCHRKDTAGLCPVRVKKCGKSALSRVETSGMDKPCLVQDQYENRACPARYDSRVGRLRPAGNCGSRQMTVASHGVQNPAYRPASVSQSIGRVKSDKMNFRPGNRMG